MHLKSSSFLLSLFAGLVLVLAGALAFQAQAQVPGMGGGEKKEDAKVVVPKDLTPAQVDKLLSRLNDSQVRQLLRERLDAVARKNEAAKTDDFFTKLERDFDRLRERIPVMIAGLAKVPEVFTSSMAKLAGERGALSLIWLIIQALGCFLIGYAVELAIRPLFRRMRQRIYDTPMDASRSLRLWRALQRAFIGILFTAIFGIVSAVLFLLFFSHIVPARMLFSTYFWAIIAVRLVGVVVRFIFSPWAPSLRFEDVPEEAARKIYNMMMLITLNMAIGFATARLLWIWGLGEAPASLILLIFALTGVIIMCWHVWIWRKPVADAIRASAESNTGIYAVLKRAFANIWHVLMLAYIIIVLVFWAFGLVAFGEFSVLGTIALVMVVPIYVLLDRASKRYFVYRYRAASDADLEFEAGGGEATAEDDQTIEGTAVDITDPADPMAVPPQQVLARNRYGVVVHRVIRILLLLASALIVMGALGVNLFASLESSVGTRIAAAVADTIIAILLAYIIYEVMRAWFDKRMAEEEADSPQQDQEETGEGGGAAKSRLATLLPIFRGFMLVVLISVTVMLILSNLGVNIGPLLAGAGIIGVAIGFGSQTLVKDVVSGAFFLIDDAFRVGEYIETGDVKGTVEKISIRSLRLRHHRGLVHTIPYGEIKSVTNYSRDWVIMKLEFRLPYGTDIEKVRKLIKKTGQAMEADPELAKGMLAPLKSQGVTRMEDSALIFRAKFTAKPGEQFVLRRVAYQRIQDTLMQNGIGFAPARVKVEIDDGGRELTEEEKAQAAGAAAERAVHPKPA